MNKHTGWRAARKEIDRFEVERQFLRALESRDIGVEHLIADGAFHRADALNKSGGHGRHDAVYVLNLDGVPRGSFNNYTDGVGWEKWVYRFETPTTSEERREFARQAAEREAETETLRERSFARAAKEAARRWESAEAVEKHPYLEAKKVGPHRLRQYKGGLLVPLRNADRQLSSLQTIYADGTKRFLQGGRVGGCYFRIGKPGETVCVAEGYATGATIHEVTGFCVYLAMNSGNLVAVAEMVRARHPDARVIVCADDDHKTEGNPGVTAARKAANAIKGDVAMPRFPTDTREDHQTDFNDMAQVASADAVKRAIEGANIRQTSRRTY
jgi:putative DNA primase/helicase